MNRIKASIANAMKVNFLSDLFPVLVPPIIPAISVTTPTTRKNMEVKKATTNTIGRKTDRYIKDGGSIKTKYTKEHRILKQTMDTSKLIFQALIIYNSSLFQVNNI